MSRVGEDYFLGFEAKGCLFILGGKYVEKKEGCVGVLLLEPVGNCSMTELPTA